MAKIQLPAVAQSGTLTKHSDTSLVPALIADAGDPAAWRYVEFSSPPTFATRTRAAPMPGRAPASSPGATSAA